VPDLPSIGELLERLAVLEKAVAARDARIEALEAENAELRRRLGQTPRNSNMPPSSQGLDKPAPKSLRGRSGRRAGGQDGHRGRTLRQVDDPDETVRHEPAVCAGCGDGPADAAVVAVTRRQVSYEEKGTWVYLVTRPVPTRSTSPSCWVASAALRSPACTTSRHCSGRSAPRSSRRSCCAPSSRPPDPATATAPTYGTKRSTSSASTPAGGSSSSPRRPRC
jgi:Family of unknown function (DUF6444)